LPQPFRQIKVPGVATFSTPESIKNALRALHAAGRRAQLRVASRLAAPALSGLFDQVEVFAAFVGTPRSGHTLIGALLNAHPDVVIGHELGFLDYVARGFARDRLYWLLLESDRAQAAVGFRHLEFDYHVPGQWQGTTRRLRIIGDKRAGHASRALDGDPGLLARLQALVGVPVRWIHVVRNPYDNAAAMAARTDVQLDRAIDDLLMMFEAAAATRARVSGRDWLLLDHEELIAAPQEQLRRLLDFLGLESTHGYLEACAALVRPAPHRRGATIAWTEGQRRRVEALIARHPELHRYAGSR
jgi:hypothetical protein